MTRQTHAECRDATSNVEKLLEDTLLEAAERVVRDGEQLAGFPHVTRSGQWLVSDHGRWTGGFFVGLLWLAHLVRKDGQSRKLAETWSDRLAFRASDRSTHDMGFLFEPSFVRGYHITGNADLAATAMLAARSLATRYRPNGDYIPAWEAAEDPSFANLTIVDTIMNLPIVLWAGERAPESELFDIGVAVARSLLEQHVRTDWTTAHTVDHDPVSGMPTAQGTHQGASSTSTWSRGQAWALHGFARVGAMTDSPNLLRAATSIAERYLQQLGDEPLPPWDFDRRGPTEPRDSAAAAIAASGLLELGQLTGRTDLTAASVRILKDLRLHAWNGDETRSGMLLHGTVDVPRASGIDVSTIYGDHFFFEALVKLRRPEHWNRLNAVTWKPSMPQ